VQGESYPRAAGRTIIFSCKFLLDNCRRENGEAIAPSRAINRGVLAKKSTLCGIVPSDNWQKFQSQRRYVCTTSDRKNPAQKGSWTGRGYCVLSQTRSCSVYWELSKVTGDNGNGQTCSQGAYLLCAGNRGDYRFVLLDAWLFIRRAMAVRQSRSYPVFSPQLFRLRVLDCCGGTPNPRFWPGCRATGSLS